MNPLERFCRSTGTTYAEIARDLGVAATSVMRWAKDERIPSVDAAVALERRTEGKVPVTAWTAAKIRARAA